MSVYRDTEGTVTFTHPIGTALTATFTDAAGTVLGTQTGITPATGGIYTAQVNWELTQYDAKHTVTWTDGNGFSRKQTFEVVTPIVDIPNLRTVWTDDGLTPPDAVVEDVEKVVRAVIETYTGQTFGYSLGSKTFIGNGSGKLILDERVETIIGALGVLGGAPSDYTETVYDSLGGETQVLTNTRGELNLDFVGLIEGGWSILFKWPEFLTIKESPPLELVHFAPSQDGTIRVPRRFWSHQDRGTHYTIWAEWGYSEVPDEVVEAAMLLANDYLTGDSGYRDRYLEILKIQQDSFTYHPGAFRGTGNARADLLLGPYRRQTGMVIL